MSDDLWLTVGDTPTLTGKVNADLSGATAEIHIRRPDQSTVTHPVDLTNAAEGEWTVDLVAGDIPMAGDYQIEIQANFGGGAIQTFALDATTGIETGFHVRSQIA